jgi:hypothetical protein
MQPFFRTHHFLAIDVSSTVFQADSKVQEPLMETSLTFRFGDEIDQREAGVAILQKYWKAFAPKDVQEWNQRIRNSGRCIIAAYDGSVIAGVLEAMRLDIGGDPYGVATTFQELTANGTWSNHKPSGDTVMLVDLTIAPSYHGSGLFEAFVEFARINLESPSGAILTYSPLFHDHNRYWVVRKHEHLGAQLTREIRRSRPGLTMQVRGEELMAEDVGITAYRCR